MKYTLIGALLLAVSAPAFAGLCTSNTTWGSLGPPGFQLFGNSFDAAGTYTDCYQFNLDASANSFGGTLELDPFLNTLNIDLTSVSLSGGGLANTLLDVTPDTFSFEGLLAGTYQLAVSAVVSGNFGLFRSPVGYVGVIATMDAPSQVPEPGTLTLVGAGLIGLTLIRRRKNQQH